MFLFYLKPYLVAFGVFLLVDAIWLKTMTASFYRPALGHLMADKPNMLAAGIFYLFYILAVCILVVYPQIKSSSATLIYVFFLGSVLGATAYGTYDFTGLAVYKNFPAHVAIIDTIWGAFLTGVVASISYAICK